jgi:hypothetical protein
VQLGAALANRAAAARFVQDTVDDGLPIRVRSHTHAHAIFISTTTKPLPDLATNTDYVTLTLTAFTTTPICKIAPAILYEHNHVAESASQAPDIPDLPLYHMPS